MKFDLAYCLSLNDKLSIYDVRDLNFDETMAPMFLNGPSDSIEKPNSLGNWLINTVSAMPFI